LLRHPLKVSDDRPVKVAAVLPIAQTGGIDQVVEFETKALRLLYMVRRSLPIHCRQEGGLTPASDYLRGNTSVEPSCAGIFSKTKKIIVLPCRRHGKYHGLLLPEASEVREIEIVLGLLEGEAE
jgi:hypothetical protein